MQQEIEQFQVIYDTIVNFFVNYSFQLLGAIIILLLGLYIAGRISKFIHGMCESRGLDITLTRFIANTVRIIIIAMVAIISLNKIGLTRITC